MATYKLVDEEKLETDLTTVADAIREKTGGTELLSFPDGMAGEVDAVFEAGKSAGIAMVNDEFQNYGKRTDYNNAYAYGWTDDVFFPNYDIPFYKDSCARVFQDSRITNLKDKLIQQGVKIDTSNCTRMLQMFQNSKILHIPELDISKVTNTSYAFGSGAAVVTIDKLIVSENTVISLSMFDTAMSLVSVTFDGILAGSIDLHWSPLNKPSIISTINALSDATSALTASFSLAAVNTAFETSEGAADGSTSEEWTTLIATKPNWTIALADA